MSALALDPTYNDFALTNGRMSLLASNSAEECAQKLTCRFGSFQGEWFMNTAEGVPWMVVLGVKQTNLAALAQFFRRIILGTPGVASIVSLPISLNRPQRLLNWSAQIQHASGAYITGGRGTPFLVAANGKVT